MSLFFSGHWYSGFYYKDNVSSPQMVQGRREMRKGVMTVSCYKCLGDVQSVEGQQKKGRQVTQLKGEASQPRLTGGELSGSL